MSYPQGPQGRPPLGNNGNKPNNNGNMNPFNNHSQDDPNSGANGKRPFWQTPWVWIVVLAMLAIAAFQLFSMNGTQTIDTKDGLALLRDNKANYAEITETKQLVTLELKNDFSKKDPDTGRTRDYGKNVQFYYVFAQGGQVVKAVEDSTLSKGYNSTVPQTSILSYLITSMLPLLIILGLFWFFMSRMQSSGGGLFGMGGKKNAGRLLDGETPKT
ncbi:MAG: AAA family ATPase, partial [Bifidobacterium sp.]